MADFVLKLDADMIDGAVHREAAKAAFERGEELVSIRYNKRNGRTNVTTRAFPKLPVVDSESDESKLINDLLEAANGRQAVLDDDRKALDAREAKILRDERRLDKRDKDLAKAEKQLANQRKKFEKDIERASRMGVFKRIKDLWNNQT